MYAGASVLCVCVRACVRVCVCGGGVDLWLRDALRIVSKVKILHFWGVGWGWLGGKYCLTVNACVKIYSLML